MDDLYFDRVYLGDFLIITSGSFEEHLSNAKEVMKRIQPDGLKCKIDKCKFVVPKVEYLEYIIIRKGIKLDPKKLKQLSILNALRTKTSEAIPMHGTILL